MTSPRGAQHNKDKEGGGAWYMFVFTKNPPFFNTYKQWGLNTNLKGQEPKIQALPRGGCEKGVHVKWA